MNDTVPTHEMIQNLAEYIVNGMSYQELTQHVYEDVYSIMLDDQEVFHANLESLGFEPEDFTNAKFRRDVKESA
jgi:uncharacterized protein YeeX (DUF496 family)